MTSPAPLKHYEVMQLSPRADQETVERMFRHLATTELLADSRTRTGILSLLYQKRRNFSHEPGMGAMQLERILSCSEALMNFHVWYLRESGLIQRLENGHFAITAAGLNRIFEIGGPAHMGTNLLTEGEGESFADDEDADAPTAES